ncbi:MAG: AAA family ATPase [Desulfovibrio sp.]|jgi:hypothetical protein|nr:AAA family ATPase [Desulfovibrio sp.]
MDDNRISRPLEPETSTSATEGRHVDDESAPCALGNSIAAALDNGQGINGGKELPPLPTHIDSFPEIRKDGFIYVDKTKYIAELFRQKRRIFCARPRRFGKSLMLSTIETLFSEKPEHRALFEDLDIAPHLSEPIFEPRPVLRLDMNYIGIADAENLHGSPSKTEGKKISVRKSDEISYEYRQRLLRYISVISEDLHVKPIGEAPDEIFGNLIRTLSQKRGNIVLLIDEYDYPLVQSIQQPIIQNKIRKTLRDFYMQIKASNRYIYFIFFTGITKFSNIGIFSEMNNLDDISIDKEYAAMYGYTEKEVSCYFKGYIKKLASDIGADEQGLIKQIKEYYDGYTFDGNTHVYNPITLQSFFAKGDFRQYWIQTGRQLFVEDFFHKKNINWEKLEGQILTQSAVTEPRNIGVKSDPKIVLYQSGYMTIREIPNTRTYKFVYPNHEVKAAMAAMMANNYFDSIAVAEAAQAYVTVAVENGDYETIVKTLNNMFSNIYKSDKKAIEEKDSKKKEDFFRGHVKTFFQGADFFVHGEVPSNEGRSDVVAIHEEKVIVIEVKYVDIKPKEIHDNIVSQYTIEVDCREKLKQAISQLYNKNYFDQYRGPLHLAIVLDESRSARVSHAAYNETAFYLKGKKPDFIEIGKVEQDGLTWQLSYTSDISASKKELSIADILRKPRQRKARGKKKTHSNNDGSFESGHSIVEPASLYVSDYSFSNLEMSVCRLLVPSHQIESFETELKKSNTGYIQGVVSRIAQAYTMIPSTSFWHALTQEEKNRAFQDAVNSESLAILNYVTQDGMFFLTSIDISHRETIGLLVTLSHHAAYGPYPLSRLLDDTSRLQLSFVAVPLQYVCKEQCLDETLPLPTPEQLLKWDEEK